MVKGWILDARPDFDRDALEVWLWTTQGTRRVVDRGYHVPFYVAASEERLGDLGRFLDGLPEVASWDAVEARTDLRSPEAHEVLRIFPRHYHEVRPLAEMIDEAGGFHDFRLYNVDLRLNQRYLLDKGLVPSAWAEQHNGWRALEDRYALEYEVPDLDMAVLDLHVANPLGIPRLQDRLLGFHLGEVEVEGQDEVELLQALGTSMREVDPDVVLTDGGDSFLLPFLVNKATVLGVDLQLGRAPQRMALRKGKSYFTYGKTVHKPGQYMLRGRVHLDRGHFSYREAALYGPVELSRLSGIPVQEMSRLSPGSAFSAMQVNEVIGRGVLIPWKKNLPEEFKTAEDLVMGDRGGFIFEPEVGIHEGIVEVDYFSLYPGIMITRNISYETLRCSCCLGEGRAVPGLHHYYTCMRCKGIVPTTLEPILVRRRHYKKRKSGKEDDPNTQRDCILKWLGCVSFGYQGFKNHRFGRIECHESINAYARDILLRSMEIAEGHGYEVVHGIVDSLWLRPTERRDPIEATMAHIADAAGVQLDLEGWYKWIVFLPCKTTGVGALNRYYGLFQDGKMKLRGIEVRKHDTSPFINQLQEATLGILSEASDAAGFLARIPRVLGLLRATLWKLHRDEISLGDAVITKAITKPLEEYLVLTNSVAALRQMKDRGFTVEPGEYIRYIITKEASRDYHLKVKVAEFIDGSERLDHDAYTRLACRSVETLLSPFGYTENRLVAECSPLGPVVR